MTQPRDVETELWKVYERLEDVKEAENRASLELKALDLVVKIRSAGQKVKPEGAGEPDDAVSKARLKVNNGART